MHTNPFTKEKHLTLKDRAMSQLREAILSGHLRAGSRLIEQELSNMMGISRFPLREAIAGLEQEGLVVINPYKGGHVYEPSIVEILEVYSVRELLEVHALELFMVKKQDEAIKKLRTIIDKMDTQQENSYNTQFMQLDFAFHNVIYETAGNKTLEKMWHSLSTKIQIYINMEVSCGDIINLRKNHEYLCNLIESQDRTAAIAELREHLKRGKEHLLGCAE